MKQLTLNRTGDLIEILEPTPGFYIPKEYLKLDIPCHVYEGAQDYGVAAYTSFLIVTAINHHRDQEFPTIY